MKFVRITFFCCCIIGLITLGGCNCSIKQEQYVRIHIRANSNSEQDQSVKYAVRDCVVKYLSPIVENARSKEDAMRLIKENESGVKRLIDGFLYEKGFNYKCTVRLTNEQFPTRVYEGITFEQGFYDALIIELGSGVGDNWWCVIYPPLCFFGEKDIQYRSIIFDIINGCFNK